MEKNPKGPQMFVHYIDKAYGKLIRSISYIY